MPLWKRLSKALLNIKTRRQHNYVLMAWKKSHKITVATVSLIAAAFVISGVTAQITSQETSTSSEEYSLAVTTNPPNVRETEADFKATIDELDEQFDAALIYWNYSQDQSLDQKGPANIATTQGEMVESLAPGLSANTEYNVEAYTEPIVWEDKTLVDNFVEKGLEDEERRGEVEIMDKVVSDKNTTELVRNSSLLAVDGFATGHEDYWLNEQFGFDYVSYGVWEASSNDAIRGSFSGRAFVDNEEIGEEFNPGEVPDQGWTSAEWVMEMRDDASSGSGDGAGIALIDVEGNEMIRIGFHPESSDIRAKNEPDFPEFISSDDKEVLSNYSKDKEYSVRVEVNAAENEAEIFVNGSNQGIFDLNSGSNNLAGLGVIAQSRYDNKVIEFFVDKIVLRNIE